MTLTQLTSAIEDAEEDRMVTTVTFSEVENGAQVRLVHSNIPDMKIDGDIGLRQVIQEGWTAAFGNLAPVLERKGGIV